MELIDGKIVKVDGSFFIKKEGFIYVGCDGQYRGIHKIESIFIKSIGSTSPNVIGFKIPSLGLTVLNSDETFLVENGSSFIKSNKIVVHRTKLPSIFANIEGKIFSALDDKTIVKLLNNNDNVIVKQTCSTFFKESFSRCALPPVSVDSSGNLSFNDISSQLFKTPGEFSNHMMKFYGLSEN